MWHPNLADDIINMYHYYGILSDRGWQGGKLGLTHNDKVQRYNMILEELTEYYEADSLVDEYDALIDILVFTVGTLVQSNLPLYPGWAAVMEANMNKIVGETKRGYKVDLKKPPGWVGPEEELKRIINDLKMEHNMTDDYNDCDDCHPRFGCTKQCDEKDVTQLPCGEIIDEGFKSGCPYGKTCRCDSYCAITNAREEQDMFDSVFKDLVDLSQADDDGVVKDDSGKTRYELVPFDSLKSIADVFAYGADKYYDNSWRTQTPAEFSRTFGSIMRHLTQWFTGEDVDPESSHSHLAHAATQIMMLMHVQANFPDRDDRIKESS